MSLTVDQRWWETFFNAGKTLAMICKLSTNCSEITTNFRLKLCQISAKIFHIRANVIHPLQQRNSDNTIETGDDGGNRNQSLDQTGIRFHLLLFNCNRDQA